MSRLDNKVAIITGGGSGMGREISILFAEQGAKVVVADWNEESGEETVGIIQELGGRVVFAKVDVTKPKEVKEMVNIASNNYGRPDILCCCAGVLGETTLLTECSEANFTTVMEINLKGVWLCMKYAIPKMIKTGGGSIINISSIASELAQRGESIYSASKAAVQSMSQVAAVEFAADDIRVNCIQPGLVLTAMAKKALENAPEIMEQWKVVSPMGDAITPEEIAQLALFLASDESLHLTGQAVALDGGYKINSNFHLC